MGRCGDGDVAWLPAGVVVCALVEVVVCSAGVVADPLGGVVDGAAGVVVWPAGEVVVWLAGALVVGALALVCGGVVCGAVVLGALALVCGPAVVCGAAVVCGPAVVAGATGCCGPPPGPPGPLWQSPPGHGGGSSGAALASAWLNVSAEMLSPAATATALTRFLDIACVPSGASAPTMSLGGPGYGQVTSISNVLVTVCGCCGLVMSVPVAVPLIA